MNVVVSINKGSVIIETDEYFIINNKISKKPDHEKKNMIEQKEWTSQLPENTYLSFNNGNVVIDTDKILIVNNIIVDRTILHENRTEEEKELVNIHLKNLNI